MYLRVKNKKIEIKEYKKFSDRFKSLKFYLKNLDFGIKLPNKKLANTTFFCQRVDICFTDNDKLTSKTWKIVYLDSNLIDLNLLRYDSPNFLSDISTCTSFTFSPFFII